MSLTYSSSISNDWVLARWDSGDYVTVCNRAVLSNLEMLKKGDKISFIWNGKRRKAKYIMRAGHILRDSMLKNHVDREQEAGSSYRMYDWNGSDDSSDCSEWGLLEEITGDGEEDWVPGDETTEDDEDEDSDKDSKKRVKLERCKRQININRSNKRKEATPSLRATPVLPKTILPRKKTHISSLQNDKSKPKKTLREQLDDILTGLQTLAKMFEQKTEGFKVIVPTKYKAENQSVVEDVTENEEANSEHEESSSPDNNVLIPKYKFVKGFSATYPSAPCVSNPSGPSVSNPSGPSVSNPAGPSVSNPSGTSVSIPSDTSVSNSSGSSASKKIRKDENKDRTRYNQSVKEDVSEDEEDLAFKLREARAREAMMKMLNHNSRTSVSNLSGPSTSNKYKAENTDRTRYNQSVKEDVSKNEEDVALKLRDARGRKAMATMYEDNLRPSVTTPSRSSVSNPSGPSTSKKYKAENTDRARLNQSVEEDVLENEQDVALILRRERVAMIKMLQDNLRSTESNPPRSSVSNPSGPSTSKKYKAENTDRARYNQSFDEDVLEKEEDVSLKFRNARAREAIVKMLKDNSSPSVSNPSGPSTSNKYKAENTDQSRHNQSFDEDVTEDEEETSDHEEFNRSDDNVLITNKYRNVTVKTVHKDDEWVPIGTGKTQIHRDKYMKVNWKSYTIATRTLLLAAFPRRVLATHSLTGKKSPAFQDKPAKNCLDPKKTSDVIFEIKKRFNVKESLIRSIITTKCADECKMFKTRLSRNNENMPPSTNGEEDE